MAFLCKQFGCLPSQLEGEDIVLLKQVTAAQGLYNNLKQCEGNIFDLAPEQFHLMKYIKELREWHQKNKLES